MDCVRKWGNIYRSKQTSEPKLAALQSLVLERVSFSRVLCRSVTQLAKNQHSIYKYIARQQAYNTGTSYVSKELRNGLLSLRNQLKISIPECDGADWIYQLGRLCRQRRVGCLHR